jgi:hypothetical protein
VSTARKWICKKKYKFESVASSEYSISDFINAFSLHFSVHTALSVLIR